MYCLFLHFLSWAYPASQSLQRAKGVFTPFPQPVQGNVPPPLASRALCALQCSPRQLFPHTSTVPNSSQGQVFVPFIVMLWYTLSIWVPLNVASMCVLAWPAPRRPPGQPPAPALETPHQPRAAGPPRNPRQPPWEVWSPPGTPHHPTHAPTWPRPPAGGGGATPPGTHPEFSIKHFQGHPTRHPLRSLQGHPPPPCVPCHPWPTIAMTPASPPPGDPRGDPLGPSINAWEVPWGSGGFPEACVLALLLSLLLKWPTESHG